MPTLRELQAAFARGVLDPAAGGDLAGRIVAGGLDPGRRLAVYRDNVLVSLRRLLEGTFPATRRHLGPERFAELALAFVRAEPPDRPQLLAYGAGFPAFLARAGAEPPAADLARLEWAREEACHAADAPPLDPASLAAIPAERYPELRFVPHPSLRLVRSAGPVFSLWQALTTDAAPPPDAGPEQALVVRPDVTVADPRHRRRRPAARPGPGRRPAAGRGGGAGAGGRSGLRPPGRPRSAPDRRDVRGLAVSG